MRYQHHQSEWSSLKCLQSINAVEGVEKRESHTIGGIWWESKFGGNVSWYNHCEEQYGGFLKNKYRTTI